MQITGVLMKLLAWSRQHKIKATTFCLLLIFTIWLTIGLVLPLGVTKIEITDAKLPTAFDGFTILQISDLQGSTDEGILAQAQKLQPDIIVFTGDNIYHKKGKDHIEWTVALVQELHKIAPVYGVTGNHDLWHVDFVQNQQLLAKAGMIHLENTAIRIEKGTDGVNIMGVTDPNTMDEQPSIEITKMYLEDVSATEGYDILLFHRANLLDELKGKGFELVLAGHNHGGQVRLPFVGGMMTPDIKWFPEYTEGVRQVDESTTAVISRGIGNTIKIPRVYNPPELVFVTLKCEG